MEIQGDGGIFMYNLASGTGGGGYDAVCIDAVTEELVINTGGDDCVVSSARFKEHITDLDLGLAFIHALTPRTFNYVGEDEARIGFIAEEVVAIDPRLVFYENDGTTVRGVRYQDMTAALTKAIQELDLKIAGIQNLTDETFLSNLRNWFADATNSITEFFSKRVHTEVLCIGSSDNETCITKAQLDALLQDGDVDDFDTPPVFGDDDDVGGGSNDESDDVVPEEGDDSENIDDEVITDPETGNEDVVGEESEPGEDEGEDESEAQPEGDGEESSGDETIE